MSKKIKIVVGLMLITAVLFLKFVVIPFYYALFANINIVKYDNCENVINITKDDLKNHPVLEKVINGDGCREGGDLCVVNQKEWTEIKNFIADKRASNYSGECFKFENYDGFYSIAYNRP